VFVDGVKDRNMKNLVLLKSENKTLNQALKIAAPKPATGPPLELRDVRACASMRTRTPATQHRMTVGCINWQCG
jgi:hypothetical protein